MSARSSDNAALARIAGTELSVIYTMLYQVSNEQRTLSPLFCVSMDYTLLYQTTFYSIHKKQFNILITQGLYAANNFDVPVL